VIRPQVVAFLDYARNHGAIIYYDVNFRSSHNNELMKLTSNILENFEYADIIRGSIDDFRNMYNVEDTDKIYRGEIEFYCHQFILYQRSEKCGSAFRQGQEKLPRTQHPDCQHHRCRRQFQCGVHLWTDKKQRDERHYR
jgi:hypothetical protein